MGTYCYMQYLLQCYLWALFIVTCKEPCLFYSTCSYGRCECDAVCPSGGPPVCTSDGQRFNNDCERKKNVCEKKRDLTVVPCEQIGKILCRKLWERHSNNTVQRINITTCYICPVHFIVKYVAPFWINLNRLVVIGKGCSVTLNQISWAKVKSIADLC